MDDYILIHGLWVPLTKGAIKPKPTKKPPEPAYGGGIPEVSWRQIHEAEEDLNASGSTISPLY